MLRKLLGMLGLRTALTEEVSAEAAKPSPMFHVAPVSDPTTWTKVRTEGDMQNHQSLS